MVLSRTKQEVSKRRAELGVNYKTIVNKLIDLCKGRNYNKDDTWFYIQFIRKDYYGTPDTVPGVIEKLRAAWWVEEEDLRQQIFYYTICYKLTSQSTFMFTLGRNLRDYLICDQKVFARATNWEELYINEQCEFEEIKRSIGLPVLFNNDLLNYSEFSLFDRYLMYLSYILKLPKRSIGKILLRSDRQICRLRSTLKKKMENYYATTTNSG